MTTGGAMAARRIDLKTARDTGVALIGAVIVLYEVFKGGDVRMVVLWLGALMLGLPAGLISERVFPFLGAAAPPPSSSPATSSPTAPDQESPSS